MLNLVGVAVIAAQAVRASTVLADALSTVDITVPPRRLPWPRILLWPWRTRPVSVRRVANVRYAPGNRRTTLDVYHHRSRPVGGPVLIHLHGGFFRIGRKSTQSMPLLHHLAARGWVCISANYRLLPVPWPAALVDARRVVAWVRHGPASCRRADGRLRRVTRYPARVRSVPLGPVRGHNRCDRIILCPGSRAPLLITARDGRCRDRGFGEEAKNEAEGCARSQPRHRTAHRSTQPSRFPRLAPLMTSDFAPVISRRAMTAACTSGAVWNGQVRVSRSRKAQRAFLPSPVCSNPGSIVSIGATGGGEQQVQELGRLIATHPRRRGVGVKDRRVEGTGRAWAIIASGPPRLSMRRRPSGTTTTMLDRILYRCEIIKLTGDSYHMDNRQTIFENINKNT